MYLLVIVALFLCVLFRYFIYTPPSTLPGLHKKKQNTYFVQDLEIGQFKIYSKLKSGPMTERLSFFG